MRVELGRKGDYAVRATLSIARSYGHGLRKAREIAAEMDVPPRYLPQILAELVRAGLLQATAGPGGGYTLARPPDQISLADVVEAAEGPLRTDVCVLRGGPCDWDNFCPIHVHWSNAERALRAELARTTFAELAAIDATIEADTYPAGGIEPHRVSSPRRGVREGGRAPTAPPPSKAPARRRRRP